VKIPIQHTGQIKKLAENSTATPKNENKEQKGRMIRLSGTEIGKQIKRESREGRCVICII
jgi:hypothetical protein